MLMIEKNTRIERAHNNGGSGCGCDVIKGIDKRKQKT